MPCEIINETRLLSAAAEAHAAYRTAASRVTPEIRARAVNHDRALPDTDTGRIPREAEAQYLFRASQPQLSAVQTPGNELDGTAWKNKYNIAAAIAAITAVAIVVPLEYVAYKALHPTPAPAGSPYQSAAPSS